MSDVCVCGHEHTAGRIGSCSQFTCACNEWRDPARVTPLPWRAGTRGGCIVADDPTPDESPLGRADPDSIAYYGGVIVCESMRTVDVDYAVRAVNEHAALFDLEKQLRTFLAVERSTDQRIHPQFDSLLSRLDGVRRDHWILCCNCGEITHESTWTYWQTKDDWEEEADKWRPSEHGEMDPMCRCPRCSWEHVDDDANPGFYEGTRPEMVAERATLFPELRDWWAESLKAARSQA